MSKRINFFDDRSKARNKIGVWLGSNTHQAVIHTIKELTSNSGDILMEGFGDKIIWTIYDNKTVEIYDNAIGLPIEGKTTIEKKDARGNEVTEEKSNYELLLLTLFAGTKHNGLETGEANTGTNGLFNTVLTYTSAYIEYEIGRPDGNIYFCSFKEGFIDKELQVIGKTNKTFTRIKYTLSDQVYTDNYFTFEEICDICQKQSALIQKPIQIIDKVNNQEKTYCLSNGLQELFNVFVNKEENTCKDIIIKDSFSKNVKFDNKNYIDNMEYNLILNYSKNENTMNMDFLNRSELIHHGTIYEGLVDGLRKSIHNFIYKEGMYNKKESNINKDDILCGLNFIIDFKSLHPNMYSNQTKFETQIKYFKPLVTQSIIDFFEVYSIENKNEMMKIADKLLINKRSREKAETNRKEAKKKLEQDVNKSTSRPNKFVPCTSKNKNEKELILIEGDSSLNSVKLSRDKYIHSIYPLKGKPLNALKKSLDEILKNEEIMDIFQILQCGMQYKGKPIKGIKQFNIGDLGVSKIIAFCDEDEDGLHIRSLLICIFYVLAPEIIEKGYFYVLDSPLYKIDTKNKTYLAYSEKEKNDIIKNLNTDNIKFTESRFKGLGGLSVDLLSETAMNIENRKLTQITINDVEKAKNTLEMFMDDDSTDRKKYIEEFGENYFDYSIYED
ncbi:toprim domain-containing protein [Clostridium rectalis]|uniref:toprim domain-containing protein n=1 Tax=Clostridium rectalis TaxID=2040295 RepID=UPI000F644F6F|nr:toprim domain-containing protein [Clostridium rectalis]